MKLLLLEDNASHSELMTERLQGLGADVVTAQTIAGAIALLEATPDFDLAVLDQDLPDGSGIEVLDFVRDRSDAMPILFVTSDDLAEHVVDAMKRGANGYVVKRPAYLTQLVQEVSSIMNAPEGSAAESRSEYEERERNKLAGVLQRNRWNVSASARELGMGRGMLRGRMSALGLDE
jgi:DNA-binding NtrC family response regulator